VIRVKPQTASAHYSRLREKRQHCVDQGASAEEGGTETNSFNAVFGARLVADFFLSYEPQKIFGDLGEYVLHPEVEHKFKKAVKVDQIVVMRLPANEELESWSKQFREMFR
jgi:hypothetical protein